MTDRAAKVLLTLIAIALWGLLLRPFISVPAVQAQPPKENGEILFRSVPASPDHSQTPETVSSHANRTIVVPYDDKPMLIIHNGKVSVWSVNRNPNHPNRLIMSDQKSLP